MTSSTAQHQPTSNQDWFLMTGDLIINLRSTKTGDASSSVATSSAGYAFSNKQTTKNKFKNNNNKYNLDDNQNQVTKTDDDDYDDGIAQCNNDVNDKNVNHKDINITTKRTNINNNNHDDENEDCLDGIRTNLELKLKNSKETVIENEQKKQQSLQPCLEQTTSSNLATTTTTAGNKTDTFTSSKISNSSSGNSSGIIDEVEEMSNCHSYSDGLSISSPNKPYSNSSCDFQFNFNNNDEHIQQTIVSNNQLQTVPQQTKNGSNVYENIIDCKYLNKSQESNLYNLIEDSKSFDEISIESDNSSLLYYSNRQQPQHQPQRCIDTPSASRLAKRLYNLEGFKKSDVSRHLSKNNEFCRTVAEEYLKLFDFKNQQLDEALRNFLSYFHLIGETQERERVLIYFSKRYNECNPITDFKSIDSIHTLTCALMLLNTDLHEQNIQCKMTCTSFIQNLKGMNDGKNYPSNLLKYLYYSVKNNPLGWIEDDDDTMIIKKSDRNVFSKITTISKSISSPYATLPRKFNALTLSPSPFVDVPNPSFAIEYKKGYIRRKCCYDSDGRKTSFGKRSWKLFYATLRDLVLYLHKDENGFRKSQLQESFANSIRIHHSIASLANDYPKKKFVFRLITADYAEYLFETSDSKELQSWIDTINTTAASLSAPTLPMAVSSESNKKIKFKKEVFPVSHTKLSLRDQLKDQENKLVSLQKELELLLEKSGGKSRRSYQKEFLEKETYLQHEIKRYRVYITCLKKEMKKQSSITTLVEQQQPTTIEQISTDIAGSPRATSTFVMGNHLNTINDHNLTISDDDDDDES